MKSNKSGNQSTKTRKRDRKPISGSGSGSGLKPKRCNLKSCRKWFVPGKVSQLYCQPKHATLARQLRFRESWRELMTEAKALRRIKAQAKELETAVTEAVEVIDKEDS